MLICVFFLLAGPDMADFPISPLVLIGAGSSLAFSRLFYHLYQEKKTELKKLKASRLRHCVCPLLVFTKNYSGTDFVIFFY